MGKQKGEGVPLLLVSAWVNGSGDLKLDFEIPVPVVRELREEDKLELRQLLERLGQVWFRVLTREGGGEVGLCSQ